MKFPVSSLLFQDIDSAINNYYKSNNINKSSSYYSFCMRSSGIKVRIPEETNHFQSVSYSHTGISIK